MSKKKTAKSVALALGGLSWWVVVGWLVLSSVRSSGWLGKWEEMVGERRRDIPEPGRHVNGFFFFFFFSFFLFLKREWSGGGSRRAGGRKGRRRRRKRAPKAVARRKEEKEKNRRRQKRHDDAIDSPSSPWAISPEATPTVWARRYSSTAATPTPASRPGTMPTSCSFRTIY